MNTKLKKTEIGLIPEDWEVKELENYLDLLTYGFTNPMPSAEDGPYLITAKNVNNGKILFSSCRRTTQEAFDTLLTDKSRPMLNDVLVTKDGTLGRIGLVDKENCCINQSVALLRPNNKIIPKFLKYLLESPYYQARMNLDARGTTIQHIQITVLKKMEVAIPSLTEQYKIVDIISKLDDKINTNQQMNRTLEAIGKAIFKHWFVHFEFPNENGQPYKSSGGEMVDSKLGEIPGCWEVQELGTVIETTGGGTPSTKKEEYWEKGNIKWFSPRDITRNNQMFITNSEKNINNSGLKHSSARLFPPLSLMMTSRATVGELSINTKEACTNQGFITCIPNEKLSTYYLYFWIKMNKEHIISLSSGSTFREINKSTFRALNIIIPSNEVLSRYNSLSKPIFNQIKTLQAQNQELTQIRDSLLPKLMSGKIRVKKSLERAKI